MVAILYEGRPDDVGLLIAAIILLGVGVMPLIAVTIGMLRIMYDKLPCWTRTLADGMRYRLATDFDEDRLRFKAVVFARFLFLTGVVLLVVGGVYVGQYKDPSSVMLGSKLVRAGYIVVVVLLAYLISFQALLWSQKAHLSHSSRTVSLQNSKTVTIRYVPDTLEGPYWYKSRHAISCHQNYLCNALRV